MTQHRTNTLFAVGFYLCLVMVVAVTACTTVIPAEAQGTWQIPISVREQQALKAFVQTGGGSVGVPWKSIVVYGASTSASAATNDAAFAAAVAAVPSYGGIVYIPGGSGCYSISTAVSVTKAVTFIGDGNGQIDAIGTSGSCVRLTSATQNGFTVNMTEPPAFINFSLVSTVATAGAGIDLTSSGAVGGLSGTQKAYISRMQFHGLWKSVRSQSTLFATIENNVFWDCVDRCIEWANTQDADQGDTIITQNRFLGPATAYGIVWNSGGGMYITDNKFLGFRVAVTLDPNYVGATQDIMISRNSIETFDEIGIQVLRNSGTGTFIYLHIVGNQISRLLGGGGVAATYAIAFGTNNATYAADIIIAHNFLSDTDVGIYMNGGTRYRIDGNEFLRMTTGAATGILTGGASATVQVCSNRFTAVTTAVNDVAGSTQDCQFRDITVAGQASILSTSNGPQDILVQNTTGTNGANIQLNGDGATTPSKYMRAKAGLFDIMSDGYSTIFTITDTGVVRVVGSGRKIEFWDADLSNNVALIAPAVTASDIVLTLPGTIGVSGQCMKTDGAAPAILSFAACVTGTADRITVSGSGGSVIDIAATYVGQATITTLGTIATGVWNAGAVTSSGAVQGTQLISTIATGTAPLTVASTTNVANLNASSLNGATFAAPGTIGGGTPAAATFTNLTATGATVTLSGVAAGAASGKFVVCVDGATGVLHKSSTGTDCSN